MTAKLVLMVALGIVPLLTAGETVGTVVTPGRVLVNNLAVRGNATITDGAVLKTDGTAARIELTGGGVLSLDAGSEAVVHRGRLQLKQGKGMVANDEGRIDALGLQVNGGEPKSQVLVAVKGGRMEVAAVRGSGKVRNQQGMMLAMVRTGKPLSFEPEAGESKSSVTGMLRRDGSKYLLRDELTGMDVELRGSAADGSGVSSSVLNGQQGRRVQATGEARMSSDTDSHVVLVSRLNRLETTGVANASEGSGTPASTSSAAKVGTAAAEAGMSAGTKIGLAALAFAGMAAAIVVPISMSN